MGPKTFFKDFYQLHILAKPVKMPINSSNMHEIRLVDKEFKNCARVGPNSKFVNEQGEYSKNRHVSSKSKVIMSYNMSKHPGNVQKKQNKAKFVPPESVTIVAGKVT